MTVSQLPLRFDGRTVSLADYPRLETLYGRVFALMSDGEWRSLAEIAAATGGSEASVSARLRDFRKPRNGAHQVNRESCGNGLFVYQLRLNTDAARLVSGAVRSGR